MKKLFRFSLLLFASLSITQAAQRPNILFIFSDDHAQEAISAYGKRFNEVSPTPNIDRIAKEGMLFRRSYCGNSICGPSRATVLTGKHTTLNGYMDNSYGRFDGAQQTFPKLLQKAGYETAVIGKWHLISNPTGFDHWEILPSQGSYYNPDFLEMDGSRQHVPGYVTDIITDKAIGWLKGRKDKDKPFVLMCQNKAPHRNWIPAPRHYKIFDGITIPEPPTLFDDYKNRVKALSEQEMQISKNFYWSNDMLLPGEPTDSRFATGIKNAEFARMTPEQKKVFDDAYGPENQALIAALPKMTDEEVTKWKYQRYIKDYLGCIRGVDENVGRMLDYLKESGQAENTIVIYSADQGFYLGEHGWYDKRWMFEESLSMPFIMKWPGVIKPGTESQALIQNIDYAPTFLDIAGAEIPADIQGKSLVPVIKADGKATPGWRDAIYYLYSGEGTHHVARHDGVRDSRYKLMYFPGTKEWMLFDLEKDPQEMTNIVAEKSYAPILAKMQETYVKLKKQYEVNSSTYPDHRMPEKWWEQRWEQKNKEASTKEAQAAQIVFLGDSITQAWEGPGKEVWAKNFAPMGALNWGFSGDRTEHLIWRLQNGNIERIHPKVAVLLIGTNNTGHEKRPAEETVQGIKRVLDDLAWKWPDTKIILMAVFPRGPDAENPLRKINAEINEQAKALADGKRIQYLDINAKYLDDQGNLGKDIFPDLLHPSAAGYQTWAEALMPKLKELGLGE